MAFVVTLTVPAGTVASTLTGFVPRVDLSHMPAAWWDDTTSDLGNVRMKQDGVEIPFHISAYNRTLKTGELFIKHTLTTSDNVFTIETVDGATALAATDPNGSRAVWSDFLAVILGQAPGINQVDGSSPATTVGTWTPSADGMLTLDTSQKAYFTVAAKSTTFTMGCTGAAAAANQATNRAMCQYNSTTSTGDADRTTLGTHDVTGNDKWALWNNNDSWLDGPVHGTTRTRCHATANGTTDRKLYVNGAHQATDTTVTAKPGGDGLSFQLAGRNGDAASGRWNGTIGYWYLRAAELSADWIAAEYASWENTSSFYDLSWPIDGVLDATLPALSASLHGTYDGPIDGTLAATLPPLTAALSGAYDAPIEGTLTAVLPPLAASLHGEVPAIEGTLAAVLPPLQAELYGTYDGPVSTDTSNALNGRSRGGGTIIESNEPVAATPPAGTPARVRVDKAIAYPEPDLIAGRLE